MPTVSAFHVGGYHATLLDFTDRYPQRMFSAFHQLRSNDNIQGSTVVVNEGALAKQHLCFGQRGN